MPNSDLPHPRYFIDLNYNILYVLSYYWDGPLRVGDASQVVGTEQGAKLLKSHASEEMIVRWCDPFSLEEHAPRLPPSTLEYMIKVLV